MSSPGGRTWRRNVLRPGGMGEFVASASGFLGEMDAEITLFLRGKTSIVFLCSVQGGWSIIRKTGRFFEDFGTSKCFTLHFRMREKHPSALFITSPCSTA